MHRSQRTPRLTPILLSAETQLWMLRLDDVSGRLYEAWADCQGAREQCERLLEQSKRVQQACQEQLAQAQHLRRVVQAKQEVIGVLLPYYPHPVTTELQRAIDLA